MLTRLILPLAAVLLAAGTVPIAGTAEPAQKAKCLVSGKEIEVTEKTPRVYVQGKAQYFCCENCPKAFAKTPEKFVKVLGSCPVLGQPVPSADSGSRLVINNGLWYVCCPGCIDGVAGSPAQLKELQDVVSGKKFKVGQDSPKSEYKGQTYYFETRETKTAFDREPLKFAVVYGK